MGHSEHFLERLDRLSAQQTEEALLLYNDPQLLRGILEMARVPERVERVAVALGDDGPYVLVTREGRFVTCLAAGMTLGDTPVVSRRQLDDFTGKVGELRARFELARSLVGTDRRGASKLVGRLMSAGSDLSREEFAAIVLWQPLIVRDLLRSLLGAGDFLRQMRDNLARTRRSKHGREIERALHLYWDAYWATGHLSQMLAAGGPETFTALPDEMNEQFRTMFAWGTIRQGGVGLALRGAWSVGRLGKTMLPGARKWMREAQSLTQYLTGSLSLLALAVRHTSLRSQVLKELAGELPDSANPDFSPLHRALYTETTLLLDDPASAHEMTRAFAETSLETRRQARGLGPVELPDSRRVPVACLDVHNFHIDNQTIAFLPALMAHVARASAEDLYLPRADLDTFGYGPWTPAYSHALLEPLTERPAAPVKAVSSVGRNDPCTCGSGKKSKKCCAA